MRQSNSRPSGVFGVLACLACLAASALADTPPTARRAPAAAGASPLSPWRTCYAGFSPHDDPRVDVLRLGVACGPVTGLMRWSRVSGTVDEGGPDVAFRFPAQKRDCFRLFAVAASPVDDLEVEITGPHGARVSLTNQSRRFVVVGEGAPFCAAEAGDFEARFSTHAGRGALEAVVYRGARMLVPGARFPTPGSGSDNPY